MINGTIIGGVELKDVAAFGQVAATLVIGLAVAYVAYQQWKTARDKFRFDLYAKRFQVYQSVMDFLGHVISSQITNPEEVRRFDTARSEAYFLFAGDKDLLKYLDEVRQRASDYAIWKEQSKGRGVGSEESKQRENVSGWLYAQLNSARDKFLPHLSFK